MPFSLSSFADDENDGASGVAVRIYRKYKAHVRF
jgi:hypothetical protein